LEAKKPFGGLASADNYFQIIRYGWNSQTPIGLLCDFEQLHIGVEAIFSEQQRELAREKSYESLKSRALTRRPTGGKAFGYGSPKEAVIVKEIFERYAKGAGLRAIAVELNRRNVPSPGSAWARKTRRATGWMNTAIRVILRNPVYTGEIVWNRYEWLKDPDSGKRKVRQRPETEWIKYQDDTRRLIPQSLWLKVQRRIKASATRETGRRKHSGGVPRHVLSGLLLCGECGSHLVLVDGRCYACTSAKGGGACGDTARLKHDVIEGKKVAAPI
jgi:site-specific DNA recombinase